MKGSTFLINSTMDQIVIDVNDPIFEIQIAPAKSKTLSDSHTASDKNCDHRLPSLIAVIFEQVIHEHLLLC